MWPPQSPQQSKCHRAYHYYRLSRIWIISINKNETLIGNLIHVRCFHNIQNHCEVGILASILQIRKQSERCLATYPRLYQIEHSGQSPIQSDFKSQSAFIIECMEVKVAQWCPTLCDPMDYAVHGILRVRILEWVAIPFSRGSSFGLQGIFFRSPGNRTQVSLFKFFESYVPATLLSRVWLFMTYGP